MRILLDECIDQRLRLSFAGHDCQTAGYAKLAGLKNGVLIAAAESAGFEILITTDQEIPYQQNLSGRRVSIMILGASTNRLSDLQRLVPAVLRTLDSITDGQLIRIDTAT
ncbi:MAG TPA: hypothetical protein DEH78_13465 [Solibacterales bacterium]|nr:hypothetical protein [Bryobacterales bacterium]